MAKFEVTPKMLKALRQLDRSVVAGIRAAKSKYDVTLSAAEVQDLRERTLLEFLESGHTGCDPLDGPLQTGDAVLTYAFYRDGG